MKYFLCKFGLSFQGGVKAACDNKEERGSEAYRQLVYAETDEAAQTFQSTNGAKVVEELTREEAFEFVEEHVNSDRTYIEQVPQYEVDENDEFVLDENGEKVPLLDENENPIIDEIEREKPRYNLPQ